MTVPWRQEFLNLNSLVSFFKVFLTRPLHVLTKNFFKFLPFLSSYLLQYPEQSANIQKYNLRPRYCFINIKCWIWLIFNDGIAQKYNTFWFLIDLIAKHLNMTDAIRGHATLAYLYFHMWMWYMLLNNSIPVEFLIISARPRKKVIIYCIWVFCDTWPNDPHVSHTVSMCIQLPVWLYVRRSIGNSYKDALLKHFNMSCLHELTRYFQSLQIFLTYSLDLPFYL